MAEIHRVNPGTAAAIGVGVSPTRSNAAHVIGALRQEAAQKQQNIANLGSGAQNLIGGAAKAAQTIFDVNMKESLHEQKQRAEEYEVDNRATHYAGAKNLSEARNALRRHYTSMLSDEEFLKLAKGDLDKTLIATRDASIKPESEEGNNGVCFRNANSVEAKGLILETLHKSFDSAFLTDALNDFRKWKQGREIEKIVKNGETTAQYGYINPDSYDVYTKQLMEFMPENEALKIVDRFIQDGRNVCANQFLEVIGDASQEVFVGNYESLLAQGYSNDYAKKFALQAAMADLDERVAHNKGTEFDLEALIGKEKADKSVTALRNSLIKFSEAHKEQVDAVVLEDMRVAFNTGNPNSGRFPETQAFFSVLRAESTWGKEGSPVKSSADSERLYTHWVNDLAFLDMSKSEDRQTAFRIMQEAVVLDPSHLQQLRKQFYSAIENTGSPQKIAPDELKNMVSSVLKQHDISYVAGSKKNDPEIEVLVGNCIKLIKNNPLQYQAIVSAAIKEFNLEKAMRSENDALASSVLSPFAGVDTGFKELEKIRTAGTTIKVEEPSMPYVPPQKRLIPISQKF
jgi:hypothetical protein